MTQKGIIFSLKTSAIKFDTRTTCTNSPDRSEDIGAHSDYRYYNNVFATLIKLQTSRKDIRGCNESRDKPFIELVNML